MKEIQKMSRLPPGKTVIVYREKTRWKLYKLVKPRDTEVDVVVPSGKISAFGINVLCPFYEKNAAGSMKSAVTKPINENKEPSIATADRQRTIPTRSHTRKQKGESFSSTVESMDNNFFVLQKWMKYFHYWKWGAFRSPPR